MHKAQITKQEASIHWNNMCLYVYGDILKAQKNPFDKQ